MAEAGITIYLPVHFALVLSFVIRINFSLPFTLQPFARFVE